MLTPILLSDSVGVGLASGLGSSCLAIGEVSVSHVVVPGGRNRSMGWTVSMTLLLATFRVVLLLSSLSTSSTTGTSLLGGIRQADLVETMLKFSHDTVNVLPSVLVLHVGRIPHEMAQASEIDGVLPMKAVTADATRVPASARLLLALGVLLSVAAFPTRFRVVVLKR